MKTPLIKRIYQFFKPAYTQEEIYHKDKHELEIKCFKNGKYIHTVSILYFSEAQINQIEEYKKNRLYL